MARGPEQGVRSKNSIGKALDEQHQASIVSDGLNEKWIIRWRHPKTVVEETTTRGLQCSELKLFF